MNYESLVGRINLIQDALQAQAAHAVNLSLTARNWLVGYYIVEFEQHGEDRAKYGENLLKKLAESLNRRGLGERRLYEYRLTYQVYPQLGSVVLDYIIKLQKEEKFTMVMVTHNANIAETADRTIKMNSGKIVDVYENKNKKTAYEIGW